MPICQYCGELEDTVTKCKQCSTKFCEYCGDPEEQLCDDCFDNQETDDEEWEYEDEDWGEETPVKTRARA
jgi:hypothetical protein